MDVKSLQDVRSVGKAVLHFWASWSEPCKHMDSVLVELAKEHGDVAFQRVEAEEVDEVTIKYDITSVPTFVFLKDGAVVDRLEGADAPALTRKAAALAGGAAPAAAAAAAPVAAAGPAAGTDVVGRIKYILSTYPVVLFMKGVAEAPRCGFSGKVVEALRKVEAPLHCIDILQDEAIRQGLKEYSSWPTYPQLYVKGELVGGCDIVLEMQASGELKQLLVEKLGPSYSKQALPGTAAAPAAAAAAAAPAPAPAKAAAAAAAPAAAAESKEQVAARVKALLSSQPVMLFMKGSPEAPQCGFSRKVVDALQSCGTQFGTFNILQDEAIRQGLKEYSNWPTYPQLYVKGELVGGCDIVLEMQASGELKSTVEEMLYRMPERDE